MDLQKFIFLVFLLLGNYTTNAGFNNKWDFGWDCTFSFDNCSAQLVSFFDYSLKIRF